MRARIHRHTNIRLRERWRIIGAVAAHRNQLAACLLLANQFELVLWRRLGEEIINPAFGRNRRSGEGIVTRDHHRADAHPTQFAKAFANPSFDDILKVYDAQQTAAIGDSQWRPA